MTSVYEIKTKHTKKVLEDFINFTYKIKYPRVTFNIVVMGSCFLVFAYLLRGGVVMYVSIAIGLAFLVFALLRKKIGVAKLAKVDKNYQTQSEIRIVFGESEFYIENPDAEQKQRIKYGEISYIYGDDSYYYISINNEDLQLLAKTDYTLGDPAEFYNFISNKTNLPIRPITIPWKMRIQLMKEYRDLKADAYEKEQTEKKKNKLKK